VPPVSEQIATSDHDIADVTPDPELEATLAGGVMACLSEDFLHGYGTLDSIDGTWKFGQNAIASGVCYAPAVFRYQLVHYFTVAVSVRSVPTSSCSMSRE